MKNILELLERNAQRFPEKIAFREEGAALTWQTLAALAQQGGTALARLQLKNRPIAIYFDKSVRTVAAMFAVTYSGNFYTVIDSEMPPDRIQKIFSSLQPAAVITDGKYAQTAAVLGVTHVLTYDEIVSGEKDAALLQRIRAAQIDTDILYALYTSGSTGMPKGAVITHRNVLAYSRWVTETFSIDENTVFGNQTPFYFSMSVTDIYATLRAAAEMVIIPKICFAFPVRLAEYLNEYHINTIYWVPSALAIAANFKLFDAVKPQYLKTVLFAGEVMPTKQLNYWIHHLGEDIVYANLFGPTETTDICTYYVVDRPFDDGEPLPIGRHCDNCDVFIVREDGTAAAPGEEGELYARGAFLAAGYYNNPEKTAQAFVQNPLQSAYPETVYKTGDLVRLNSRGEILYICRRDYQIKHMGYRIELGEIEAAANAVDGVRECACIYDETHDKLVLFYSAVGLSEDTLVAAMSRKLPPYMLPNRLEKRRTLPHNQNGKIDRRQLQTQL